MNSAAELPEEWAEAPEHPPVADDPVDPYLLGVGVDELVVDLDHRR